MFLALLLSTVTLLLLIWCSLNGSFLPKGEQFIFKTKHQWSEYIFSCRIACREACGHWRSCLCYGVRILVWGLSIISAIRCLPFDRIIFLLIYWIHLTFKDVLIDENDQSKRTRQKWEKNYSGTFLQHDARCFYGACLYSYIAKRKMVKIFCGQDQHCPYEYYCDPSN